MGTGFAAGLWTLSLYIGFACFKKLCWPAVWCRGINTWCKHPSYPAILKRTARKMVRSGITKREVAGMLGIPYNTLCYWTADIHNPDSRLGVAAEKILAEVVEMAISSQNLRS